MVIYIGTIQEQQIANHDKVFLMYLNSPTIILWQQTVPYTWAVGEIEVLRIFYDHHL